MSRLLIRTLGLSTVVFGASCQLVSGLGDFNSGEGGNGGAASTSLTSGPSAGPGVTSATSKEAATSTIVSGTTGAGKTTATASSSTGSGGAGGAAELVPCGGITDTFGTLDPAVWETFGNAMLQAGRIVAAYQANADSGIRFKMPGHFDKCYASVRVPLGNSDALAFLRVEQALSLNRDEIDYRQVNQTVTTVPAGSAMIASVNRLGLAFHGGQIYFLIANGGTWNLVTQAARPLWMAGSDSIIGFGMTNGNSGSFTINFDDFNELAIQLSDLQ